MENNIEVKEYDLEAIEQYNNLMDVFKVCFKNEAVQFIKECRDYIISMREDIQTLKAENEVIKTDCYEMAKILNMKFKEMDYNG